MNTRFCFTLVLLLIKLNVTYEATKNIISMSNYISGNNYYRNIESRKSDKKPNEKRKKSRKLVSCLIAVFNDGEGEIKKFFRGWETDQLFPQKG